MFPDIDWDPWRSRQVLSMITAISQPGVQAAMKPGIRLIDPPVRSVAWEF